MRNGLLVTLEYPFLGSEWDLFQMSLVFMETGVLTTDLSKYLCNLVLIFWPWFFCFCSFGFSFMGFMRNLKHIDFDNIYYG